LKTEFKNFKQALKIQTRTIHALIMREALSRFGERKLGYIWAFLEPVIHILTLILLHQLMGFSPAVGIDSYTFFVTGLLPFFLFRNVISKTMEAINANRALLVFPQIKFLDLMYSRAILETITFVIVYLLMLLFINFIIHPVSLNGAIKSTMILFIVAVLGFSIGLLFSVIASFWESFKILISSIIRILYFVSGVFFSVTSIPEEYYVYLAWNPLLICITLIRDYMFTSYYPPEIFISYNHLFLLILANLYFGLLLVKKMSKWVTR
jgi:capsular polysaccharide transport system permease protein